MGVDASGTDHDIWKVCQLNSIDSATSLEAQWTAYRHWTKCAVVGDRRSAEQGLAGLLAEATDLTAVPDS